MLPSEKHHDATGCAGWTLPRDRSTNRSGSHIMRWTPGRQSDNIEDRRGTRMRAGAGVGIGGLLILGVLTLVTGRNFLSLAPLLESQGGPTQQGTGPIQESPEEQRRVQFVS